MTFPLRGAAAVAFGALVLAVAWRRRGVFRHGGDVGCRERVDRPEYLPWLGWNRSDRAVRCRLPRDIDPGMGGFGAIAED